MASLLPHLFGGMTDSFEMEFPRPASVIRSEGRITRMSTTHPAGD